MTAALCRCGLNGSLYLSLCILGYSLSLFLLGKGNVVAVVKKVINRDTECLLDLDELLCAGHRLTALPLVDCLSGHLDRAGKLILIESSQLSDDHELLLEFHNKSSLPLLRLFLFYFFNLS